MKRSLAILLILTVLATAFIFYNSLQNSTDSNGASDFLLKLLEPVTDAIERLFGELDWNYIIRKGAHLTEFCILGVFVSLTALNVKKNYAKHIFGYGLFYVLLVAVTDEFIQSFSDRTSSVKDVLIDLTGALIGILIVILADMLKNKAKGKKNGN